MKSKSTSKLCTVIIGDKVYQMTKKQARALIDIGYENATKHNDHVIVGLEKGDKVILKNLQYKDRKEFFLQKGKFQEQGYKVTAYESKVNV